MARPLREEVAGGLYHVYARGNNRRPIYLADGDRSEYLRLLARTARCRQWNCLAYCLMENHVHLLLETPLPNLSAGMQQLHGEYARRFNDRYGAVGHLFQSRFGSKRVLDDPQLLAVLRYIAMNPVEAGLCHRPEEYDWSSYGSVTRGEGPTFVATDRLRWFLGGLGGDPVEQYHRLVADEVWT